MKCIALVLFWPGIGPGLRWFRRTVDHHQITTEDPAQSESREADVKRGLLRLKPEFDPVPAWCEINATHDVIAAEHGRRLAIHPGFPMGMKAIIQQQHCGRGGIGEELDELWFVAGELDRASGWRIRRMGRLR